MLINDLKEGNIYTESIFLHRLNDDGYCYREWLYPSFFEFVLNLLKSLCSNNDIVLLDKDFSEEELKKLGYATEVKTRAEIHGLHFSSYEEVTAQIRKSQSKITFFTSGTTGLPKKVQHTISSLTKLIRVDAGKYSEKIWGMAYNPTHMAGIQVLLQALLNKNSLVYLFESNVSDIAQSINEHRITHISATPTFYRILLGWEGLFPNVERVTLGGEKSSEHLLKQLSIKFPNARINNIYASTEYGALFVAKNDVFEIPKVITDKVKVIEDELFIHNSLLGEEDNSSEWKPTGDLVNVVTTNPLSFKFVSRKTEMINVGGNKINPNDVEEEIMKLNGVIGVRVFGKENSVLGNILCADIVLERPDLLNSKEIKSMLVHKLQDYKIPQVIKFVDELNTTRTGKISRV